MAHDSRSYRVDFISNHRGESGYMAMYLCDYQGQWSLVLDGTWATPAERVSLMEGVEKLASAYMVGKALPLFTD